MVLAIAALILTSPSLSRLSLTVEPRYLNLRYFNRLIAYIENCIIVGLTIISLVLLTLMPRPYPFPSPR